MKSGKMMQFVVQTAHQRCAAATRLNTIPRLRTLSTTVARRAEATPSPNLGTVKPPKKPIGGFRGGVVGFLLGFSLASSFAAYHLLDEYQRASAALQASVMELQISTEKVTGHIRRIEAVEKELKALSGSSASKEDVSRLRSEVKKLYDGLHVEFLDLKTHVWGLQQDVHTLSKENKTTRI